MIEYRVFGAPRLFPASVFAALGQEAARTLRWRRARVVGVRWVDLEAMRRLNRAYRGYDRPTDVLSFTAEPSPDAQETASYLGDLVICPEYAEAEAARRGIPTREELLRLLIHGTLHLAGYDHARPTEEKRMFALQEACLERTVCRLRS